MKNSRVTALVVVAAACAGCESAEDVAADPRVPAQTMEAALSTGTTTTTETATTGFSNCGTRPSNPCFAWSCINGSWEAVAILVGASCGNGGTCNASGQCAPPPPPSTPAVTNHFMFAPTQVAYDMTCASGSPPPTTTLRVNIDGRSAVTLPDTCTFFGSGRRYDFYDVRGGQNRCYSISASNSNGTVHGTTTCFNTPEDLTPPAPPGNVSVTPGIRTASVLFTDLSTNETQFRCYIRRANQNAQWQLTNTIERYNPEHHTGYPHPGTGELQECGPALGTVQLDVDYEIMVEAYHDHAERTSSVVLPPFRSLPPLPERPLNAGVKFLADTSYVAGWDPSEHATFYNVYQQIGHGGAWQLVATTAATQQTVTGLPPSTYCCVDVTAGNISGESVPGFGHPHKDCFTTMATPPAQGTQNLNLHPKVNATTGQVFNGGTFTRNATLDFIELRAEDNPSLAGVLTSRTIAFKGGNQPPGTGDVEAGDCAFSAPGAAFLDADGVLHGSKITAIYGTANPPLLTLFRIGFCPIWTTIQNPPPDLNVIVHYTGY